MEILWTEAPSQWNVYLLYLATNYFILNGSTCQEVRSLLQENILYKYATFV